MKELLIFGDSIAFGKKVSPEDSWPQILKYNMETVLKNPVYLHNFSQCGGASSDMVKIVKDGNFYIYNTNSIAVIAVGINDAKFIRASGKNQTSISDFSDNISYLIRFLLNNLERKNIVLLSPTSVDEILVNSDGFPNIFENQSILNYAQIMRSIGQDMGVLCIDAPDFSIDDLLADGLHPSPKGHKKIFETVKHSLFSLI